MIQKCSITGQNFEITEDDISFYNKFYIPNPKICFQERLRKKMAWRNDRSLYKRKCDKCEDEFISLFRQELPYTVFCRECYFSDDWDAMDYGRDFDFKRPFFEQFEEFFKEVPKLGLYLGTQVENSDFNNNANSLKNCYLIFNGSFCEDSMYGYSGSYLTNCLDFLYASNSELCYEVIDSGNLYNSKYCVSCDNCSDSYFLKDCIGCKNCFACNDLKQQEFCIFNEKVSKEKYDEFMNDFQTNSFQLIQEYREKVEAFFKTQPTKKIHGYSNENVSGEYIFNSKNSYNCYQAGGLQDCKYCFDYYNATDSYDIFGWGSPAELCYNSTNVGDGIQNIFCSWDIMTGASDIYYSTTCSGNIDKLFGCCQLTKKAHCILNKQYSKEDYMELFEKIKSHMIKTGEWGEFFPIEMSPFAYSETIAEEYFPLSKEECQNQGLKWYKDETIPEVEKIIDASELPDINDDDIPEEIINWAIKCEISKRPFVIQKAEFEFYKKMKLPLPRRHPDIRYMDRIKLLSPLTNAL